MTGGILQSAAGFPLYQRNSIPRRTGASTPSMRQGFSQARSPVQVKASAPNPSSNRAPGISAGGDTGDWRTSMPGMPALSGGEIGRASCRDRVCQYV